MLAHAVTNSWRGRRQTEIGEVARIREVVLGKGEHGDFITLCESMVVGNTRGISGSCTGARMTGSCYENDGLQGVELRTRAHGTARLVSLASHLGASASLALVIMM